MAHKMLSALSKINSVARLRRAIMNDDTNKICHILDSERHILFKDVDHDGNSPLMLAVRYASPVTIRVLLSLGAHPDALNLSNHQTSLTYLAELKCDDDNERSYEIAKTLLEADADVDKPRYTEYTDEHGNVYLDEETPLMIAIKNNNLRLAKLFCKNGANVNFARERTKIRPIHIAVAQGNSAMFDLLVNCGAKVKNVLTVDDNSLLHWFCFYRQNDNQLAIVKSLLEQGCDVDAGNSHRRTPLMLAARHGLIETIRILLHAGAKMDITDYKGYRAIDLAKQQNQMDCYQLLKQNSSNKDLTSRRRPVARQPIIHTTSEQKRVVPQKADSHVYYIESCILTDNRDKTLKYDKGRTNLVNDGQQTNVDGNAKIQKTSELLKKAKSTKNNIVKNSTRPSKQIRNIKML